MIEADRGERVGVSAQGALGGEPEIVLGEAIAGREVRRAFGAVLRSVASAGQGC